MNNNGVCIKAGEDSLDGVYLYGRLKEIIEFEYPAMSIKRVTMLKCQWYDLTPSGHGVGTHVDIHIGRYWGKYDSIFLASQASQVYCMSYPNLRQDL